MLKKPDPGISKGKEDQIRKKTDNSAEMQSASYEHEVSQVALSQFKEKLERKGIPSRTQTKPTTPSPTRSAPEPKETVTKMVSAPATKDQGLFKMIHNGMELNLPWKEYLAKSRKNYLERRMNPNLPIARKNDFELLKTLGSGAFGRVMLVKHLDTNRYYAAKLLKKADIVKNKHISQAKSEKQILQSIRFVFTIHLEFFFHDNVYLFFILPFVSGGELFTYLSKSQSFKEEETKFYAAQILLAFEYLHNVDLIYRDLKPENVLLDHLGYLKLADFGFCKTLKERTYTFCGTTEYLAPEVINCKGYGKSVDWWTFGVFLYELCAGVTPFYAKNVPRVYDNITKCRLKFPPYFSGDLCDLIRNILQVDLSRRYGMLKSGVGDIKNHKWYANFPWAPVFNKELVAPYVPTVKKPDDLSNFDPQPEKPLEVRERDLYAFEFANF